MALKENKSKSQTMKKSPIDNLYQAQIRDIIREKMY